MESLDIVVDRSGESCDFLTSFVWGAKERSETWISDTETIDGLLNKKWRFITIVNPSHASQNIFNQGSFPVPEKLESSTCPVRH